MCSKWDSSLCSAVVSLDVVSLSLHCLASSQWIQISMKLNWVFQTHNIDYNYIFPLVLLSQPLDYVFLSPLFHSDVINTANVQFSPHGGTWGNSQVVINRLLISFSNNYRMRERYNWKCTMHIKPSVRIPKLINHMLKCVAATAIWRPATIIVYTPSLTSPICHTPHTGVPTHIFHLLKNILIQIMLNEEWKEFQRTSPSSNGGHWLQPI